MKRLRFEGYSDDTFGIDHDNCANGKPIVFDVSSEETGESFAVVGMYGAGAQAGWAIGVERADINGDGGGGAIPSWTMRFTGSKDTPYSPALHIEAPDDVTIKLRRDK